MRRTLLRYALIASPFVAIGVAGAIGLLHTGDAIAQPATTTTITVVRPASPGTPTAPSATSSLPIFAVDCLGAALPGNPMLIDGASVVIDVDGFGPNATVTLSVAGQTTAPITQRADASGDLRTIYHVPANLAAGQHVLTLTATPGTAAGLSAVTTAGPTLPQAFYPFWVAAAPAVQAERMYPGSTYDPTIQAADCGAVPPPPLAP